MPERLTIDKIRQRCATMDARMSGLPAWSVNVFEYPHGRGGELPMCHVYYERFASGRVVRFSSDFELLLPCDLVAAEAGPSGGLYYGLGDGWVLHVMHGTKIVRVNTERCVVCGDEMRATGWAVTACFECCDD